MKKRIIIFILIMGSATLSHGQQRFQLTHYMVNPFVFNPALAGTEEFLDIKAGFREQWMGMKANPRTYYASAHAPFLRGPVKPNEERSGGFQGIGGYIYNDVTGPTSRAEVAAAYAYNTPLFRDFRLSMGAFAGLQQYKINGNRMEFQDAEAIGLQRSFVPNIALGTWFYNSDMYLGFSANQILQSKLNFNIYETMASQSGRTYSRLTNHFYAMGGYRIPIMNTDFTAVPSVFAKYQPSAPVSVDINGKISYKDQYWSGLSYRVGDALSAMLGFVYDDTWELAYSFDLNTSELQPYHSGTHEVTIGYRYKFGSDIYCPQHFW